MKLLAILSIVIVSVAAGGLGTYEYLSGSPKDPDVQQIEADLIGHEVGEPFNLDFRFVSMSVFEKVTIVSKTANGNVREYKLDIILTDPPRRYRVTVWTTYRLTGNQWQLANIANAGLTKIN